MGSTLSASLVLPDGGIVSDDLAADAGIQSTQLEERASQLFGVSLSDAKTWDDFLSDLPTTAAADDLALVAGTTGTNSLTIETGDLKAAGATTRKAGFELIVPANYKATKSYKIRVRAGMKTTVADTSATVDVEAYKADGDGLVGSDLCSTSATTINSLSKANVDFTISASSLSPGDKLFVVVSVAVNDAATGTAVIGQVSDLKQVCTTQG